MGLSSITKIPAIMRANKWFNGASLMDEWFAGPAAIMPAYTTPDPTTLKMDSFILTFARARTVFDGMVRDKVWMSDKAKPVFASRLPALGVTPGAAKHVDTSARSAPDQHSLHVNRGAVPSITDFDDMEAALGNFSIYVVPLVFDVTPESGKSRITLSWVGFHVMDSYDFEGHQLLGFWDEGTNRASAFFFFHSTEVDNGDFRDWRTANKKGGDFQVFSDVKKLSLNPPDSFLV